MKQILTFENGGVQFEDISAFNKSFVDLYKATNTSLPVDTFVKAPFTSSDVKADLNSEYDSVNNKVIVKQAGVYVISLHCGFRYDNNYNEKDSEVRCYKNGACLFYAYSSSTSSNPCTNITKSCLLSANDEIEMYLKADQYAGGTWLYNMTIARVS